MALNWNVSILAQPSNPANWLVAAVYDASAPTVLVDSIPLPKPYGGTKNITFMNLEGIVYNFRLFESATTSPVGTVLNGFSFQPSLGSITVVRNDLYLTGDISPDFPSGQNGYDDNSLIGWSFDLERVGMGTLEKGVDYELTLDGVPDDSLAANGWRLLRDEDVVGEEERFVHHFQPRVTSSSSGTGSGGGGNMIAGSTILDSDIVLDNTYMKKVCLLQGNGVDYFTVALPPLSTVADNQLVGFISAGGDHVNASVVVDNTDSILFNGIRSRMTMGQCEQFWLFKAYDMWNVAFPDGNFKTVGEIVYSYVMTELNSVFANGGILSRTTYARLWNDFVSQLPPSMLISDSGWNSTQVINGRTVYINRGKFTTGDGSTTFRVPMIYAVGNLKIVDGSTRLAGSFEADQVGQFSGTINIPQGNSYTGGGGNDRTGRGSASPNDLSVTTTFNSNKENKEANFGVYALIRC
ncbi:MAG: hypothetical protein ACTHMC_01575 [Pseudobacter sp.]|uniref:hypothetical protein n=1 Tax=Pseudobacter sp. TaxID=2045420 RepID=UPI003F80582B